jgi:hypothetical protein
MLIGLGYERVFQVWLRTPLLLMLFVYPSQAIALLEADRVHVEPDARVKEFTDSLGNRCGWLITGPGKVRWWSTTLIEVSGEPDVIQPGLPQPVEELLPEVLPFLLGSRYCEVDKLTAVAWSLFGYEFANSFKSASDTYRERTGGAATSITWP